MIVSASWHRPSGTARPDRVNSTPKLLPEHDDPAVRGRQVLQAVNGDRSLTDLGFVIAGSPLTLVGIGGELGREP
jgi:hypothetical protein